MCCVTGIYILSASLSPPRPPACCSCEHYKRGCKLLSPCCNKVGPLRILPGVPLSHSCFRFFWLRPWCCVADLSLPPPSVSRHERPPSKVSVLATPSLPRIAILFPIFFGACLAVCVGPTIPPQPYPIYSNTPHPARLPAHPILPSTNTLHPARPPTDSRHRPPMPVFLPCCVLGPLSVSAWCSARAAPLHLLAEMDGWI